MTNTNRIAVATVAAGIAALTLGLAAPVAAYTVSGTLLGDPRNVDGENPTNLKVNFTVVVGSTATGCTVALGNSCSHWTIDLDMAATHPNVKLHEFYFNLGQAGEETKFAGATFSNFSPAEWTVTSPAGSVGGGSFTPEFMFEANDPPPGPPSDVTNTTSLTYNMILSAGNSFDVAGTSNDFIGTNLRLSETTAFAGEWQMGAHLQALNQSAGNCPFGCNTDSGFAVGGFGDTPDDPPPPGVAEPGTMALFSLGLVGLGLARRRRNV